MQASEINPNKHPHWKAAPFPSNEAERIAALVRYEILDTPQEEEFDDITALAAYICQVPIALISFVDRERQWFKSKLGLLVAETTRNRSFCSHAILQPEGIFVVPDATLDDRFADNPLVTGDPHIRFYAGTPLLTPDRLVIGTLCLLDRQPRQLDPQQLEALQRLGRQVVAQLELRISYKQIARERHNADHLLLNILPPPIAEQLKKAPGLIAQGHENVTILFADLVNFTALSNQVSPTELVNLLNQIVSLFDQLTEDLDLEKIKTIGDSYMVASGLPLPREDHAEAIADFALAMLATLRTFNQDHHTDLHLRIGINTGSVVAGVIGTKKFVYDLWGDAVNTASRMESHGVVDAIQVSESTYHLLKHRYHLEPRSPIVVKGKGSMRVYLLKSKRS